MTAEQLEELLARISDPNNASAASDMAALWRLAPSLARRAIAAEDLAKALDCAVDAWETHCSSGDGMQGYWASDARAALSSHREASK